MTTWKEVMPTRNEIVGVCLVSIVTSLLVLGLMHLVGRGDDAVVAAAVAAGVASGLTASSVGSRADGDADDGRERGPTRVPSHAPRVPPV